MQSSRPDLLLLVAGLAATGGCQDRPPAEPVESAAVLTVPAESTGTQAAAAPAPAPAAAPAARPDPRRAAKAATVTDST